MTDTVNYDAYIIDTNILLRYLMRDDELQFAMVKPYFTSGQYQLVIPIHAICETVWFMRSRLKTPHVTVINLLKNLANQQNVTVNESVFNMGIRFMQKGGDFADGVIAHHVKDYQNASLLTFDKKAQKIAKQLNLQCIEPHY